MRCKNCPLAGNLVKSDIPANADVVFVGESPGAKEARRGKPFIEPSGQLLRGTAQQAGFKHPGFANILQCAPGEGAGKQARLDQAGPICLPRLLKELPTHVPIVALGQFAQGHLGLTAADRWEYVAGRWYIGGIHPAAILRGSEDQAVYLIRTLQKAAAPRVDSIHDKLRQFHRPSPELITSFFETNDPIAVDLEASSTDWTVAEPSLFGAARLSDAGFANALILDLRTASSAQLEALRFGLERAAAQIGGHNYKYDAHLLHRTLGYAPPGAWDTMVMAHKLHEHWYHGLKDLATYYFDAPDWAADLDGVTNYNEVSYGTLSQYLAYDVLYTLHLYHKQRTLLETQGRWQSYVNFDQPQNQVLQLIERRGIMVDLPAIPAARQQIEETAEQLRSEVAAATDGVVKNPRSPKQVAEFAYDVLGLRAPYIPGLPNRSTDKRVLAAWAEDHPTMQQIITYRRITKMDASYLKVIERFERGGRVHPNYKDSFVVTGRLSATDPAIQTIPRTDDAWGKAVKNIFVASPGYVLLAVDGSQAELRVAAALSKDPSLTESYRAGGDAHGVTHEILKRVVPGISRAKAKNINFGVTYGGDLRNLIAKIGITDLAVMDELEAALLENLGGLLTWSSSMFDLARTQGYLEAPEPFRTRHHFHLITKENVAQVRRYAVNYIIQGIASKINSLCAIRVFEPLRALGGHIVILKHDEVTSEVPEDKLLEAARLVKYHWETAAASVFPELPWLAEVEAGRKWGELHEVVGL